MLNPEKDSTEVTGEWQRTTGEEGAGSFLKFTIISTVFRAPACSCCSRTPDGPSHSCRLTCTHRRWGRWGWCHPQTSGVWQTGPNMQLLVYRENRRGETRQPWGAPVSRVRDMLPQSHELPSVHQEVHNPPSQVIRHIQLWELVSEQSWNDGIKSAGWGAQIVPWSRVLGSQDAGGWSEGPWLQRHLQICWLCRLTVGERVCEGFEVSQDKALRHEFVLLRSHRCGTQTYSS